MCSFSTSSQFQTTENEIPQICIIKFWNYEIRQFGYGIMMIVDPVEGFKIAVCILFCYGSGFCSIVHPKKYNQLIQYDYALIESIHVIAKLGRLE